MKKLVVPTDFSEDAAKAYPLAIKIAKSSGATIVLLHVLDEHLRFIENMPYDIFDNSVVYTGEEKTKSDEAENKMKNLIESKIFEGVEVEFFISDSIQKNPLKIVLEFLNKKEHSLVVLGTSGDDTFGDTNAEFTARRAVVPVLSVRDINVDNEIDKILLSTDFKTIDIRFINRIKLIADLMEAEIDFVYVNTPKKFKDTDYIEKEWSRFKKRFKIEHDRLHIFNDHDVELGIMKVLERTGAGMLALPTHGRTGLLHMFKGSYVEDIINKANVPVFSYNMSNDYHAKSYSGMGTTRGFTG
jgi:nucleotide-binding universal stress UspA family protein